MAQFPALPLFTDALTADCSHLDDAEFGRYLRLLIMMWRTPGCRVPADAQWIAKRLRIDALAYPQLIQPILQEFCTIVDGHWVQKRLQKEYEYVQALSEKRKAAAASRWNKHEGIENIDKKDMQVHEPRISKPHAPTPTPTPTHRNTSTGAHHSPRQAEGFNDMGGGVRSVMAKAIPGQYSIMDIVTGECLEAVREAAPGWGLDYLAGVYNQNINSGKLKQPDHPNKAFPAWAAKYTKGKPPR